MFHKHLLRVHAQLLWSARYSRDAIEVIRCDVTCPTLSSSATITITFTTASAPWKHYPVSGIKILIRNDVAM
eukprot:g3607.t1